MAILWRWWSILTRSWQSPKSPARPAATHPRPPVVRANSCSTPGRKPTSRVYLVVTCFDRLGNLRPDVGRPNGSISLQAAQNAGTPVLEFLLLLASAGMPTDQHTSKQAPHAPPDEYFGKLMAVMAGGADPRQLSRADRSCGSGFQRAPEILGSRETQRSSPTQFIRPLNSDGGK